MIRATTARKLCRSAALKASNKKSVKTKKQMHKYISDTIKDYANRGETGVAFYAKTDSEHLLMMGVLDSLPKLGYKVTFCVGDRTDCSYGVNVFWD